MAPKPTYKPYSNKFSIVRVEGVEFCAAFVGGVPGTKICGLMKGVDMSCKKYKTHAGRERRDVESAFYLTSNGKHLFLNPLVSLTIGDVNKEFISQVGDDLSKDTATTIMDEVNQNANNSTERFDEAAYVKPISTTGKEVIDKLVCGYKGSS